MGGSNEELTSEESGEMSTLEWDWRMELEWTTLVGELLEKVWVWGIGKWVDWSMRGQLERLGSTILLSCREIVWKGNSNSTKTTWWETKCFLD